NYQDVSQFNAAGQLTQVLDPHGVGLTYQYDASGRLSKVIAPDHGVTTLDYSTPGQVIIDEPGTAAAQRWVTVYVAGGNLTRLEHDESIDGDDTQVDARRSFSYDTAHHLIADSWHPWYTQFRYDPNTGLVTSVDQGSGSVTTLTPANAEGAGAQGADWDLAGTAVVNIAASGAA